MKLEDLFQVGKHDIQLVFGQVHVDFDGQIEVILEYFQIADVLLLGVNELVDDLLGLDLLVAHGEETVGVGAVDVERRQLLVELNVRAVHPREATGRE